MYEVEGYSHEEIAREFGRSVSFSKSQLARAHRRLHNWLMSAEQRPTCNVI
jgi:RNA polymerase sigma-70 factor (ECF subfamily)